MKRLSRLAACLLVLTAQGAAAGSARLTLSTSTFDLTRRDSPAACKTGLPNDSGMLATRKSPFCLGLPWQTRKCCKPCWTPAAPNADGLRIIDPVHFIETLEREYAS